jgi:hypothetical protein
MFWDFAERIRKVITTDNLPVRQACEKLQHTLPLICSNNKSIDQTTSIGTSRTHQHG